MTAIARLEIIPVQEQSMSEPIAAAIEALDEFDVSYETTATDTIIEADSAEEAFEAARAAHEAVDGERVITSVEIDDMRSREQDIEDRVSSVERELVRKPERMA